LHVRERDTVRARHTVRAGLTHAKFSVVMATPNSMVKVLLIRPWIHSLAPLRDALRSAGLEARFTRVDIEPALNAALVRGGFDVAIVDPGTPGLSHSTLEARLREHRGDFPIVVLEDLETLGERVKLALAARRS
jgi:DNA-binding response OmpR family regulator